MPVESLRDEEGTDAKEGVKSAATGGAYAQTAKEEPAPRQYGQVQAADAVSDAPATSPEPSPTHTPSRGTKRPLSKSPSPPARTPYRDIPLLSTSLHSTWTHHLIRLAHHSRVDPTDPLQFVPPVKLNRKQPPKVKTPPLRPGDPVVDGKGKPIKLENGETLKWPKVGDDLTDHEEQVREMKSQEQ